MARFDLDFKEVENLHQRFEAYGEGANRVVNDVLHEEGGDKIKTQVQLLIPSSGRHWKRKKAAASATDPLQIDNGEMLAVTVKTIKAYHYLYFPDDGTNTERHAGNQQFFMRGGEQASGEIIDLCLGRLIDEIT